MDPKTCSIGILAALLAAAMALASCSRAPREPKSNPADSPGRAASGAAPREEVDRLRSLPYAGYAPDDSRGEKSGVVVHDRARSWPGYNLYSIHEKCTAELIDADGRVVRSWRHQPSSSWSNCELLPNGDLLVVGWDSSEKTEPGIADQKRYILRFDWNGRLLWKRFLPAHHDIEQIPDGRLLTLTFQRRSIPAVNPTIEVRDDQLSLLDDSGRPRRSLSFFDTFSAADAAFPFVPVRPTTTGGRPWIDLFHGNSVERLGRPVRLAAGRTAGEDDVLVCFRHQDRVAIIDPERGRLIWSWGLGEISGPHDAQLLADGHILLFDNGVNRGWSRVIELDPVAEKIVWEYRAPNPRDFFSVSRGACQRLPNGNTLITNSDHGVAFEVTPDGTIVWQFNCPYQNAQGQRATIVRLKRYERLFVDRLLAGRRGGDPGAAPAAR